MPDFKDSLNSAVRCIDITFAIDLSDFISRLSVPGPLLLSNLSMSSYTSDSVILLKVNSFFDFFLQCLLFDVDGISFFDMLGSFVAKFSATGE